MRGAIFSVGSLVMERGRMQEVLVHTELMEMLDAELHLAVLDVGRLVAATGLLEQVHISRCGQVALSQLALTTSFVAACEEPLDVRDVAIEWSIVRADVVGRGGGIRHSAFGGARVALHNGEISSSALCGTASVDVSSVDCVRCEPSAPPDVCGSVSAAEEFCPGLCASTCSTTGEPSLPPEACAS